MSATAAPPMFAIKSSHMTDGSKSILLLCFYLFLAYGRIPELMSLKLGFNLYPAFLTLALAIVAAFLNGGLFRASSSRAGIVWIGFSLWLLLCIPTSVWKGNSVLLFKDVWSRSFITFLITAGLVTVTSDVRRAMFGIAAGTSVVVLTVLLLGNEAVGRFEVHVEGSEGLTFANANGLATQLLFGLPACFLVVMRSRGVIRLAALATIGGAGLTILRTGSRGGLIILTSLLLLVFLRAKFADKFKMMLICAVLLPIGIMNVGNDAWERYRTLFLGNDVASASGRSALESKDQREFHIRQSIRLTFENPVFGVGPGNFTSASADDSKELGIQATWRNTHNAYTQVSSEMGFAGIVLFLCVLSYSGFTATRMYRRSKKLPEHSERAAVAFCLSLMCVTYTINGIFDSNAYMYHLPVISGLVTGLVIAQARTAQPSPQAVRLPRMQSDAGVRSPLPQRA